MEECPVCQEARPLRALECGGGHGLCDHCIVRMPTADCPLCRRASVVLRTAGVRRRLDFDDIVVTPQGPPSLGEPEVLYGDAPVDPGVYKSAKIHCMLSFVVSTCLCLRRRIPEAVQVLNMVRALCVPPTSPDRGDHGLKFLVGNVPFANPNAVMILQHARFLLSNTRYVDAVERNYLRYIASQLDGVLTELT